MNSLSKHAGYSQLQQRLQDARTLVNAGGAYAHYKHPHKPYVVQGLCIIEATEEIGVLYTEPDSGVVFVRPISSWLEVLSVNSKSVRRFTALDAP